MITQPTQRSTTTQSPDSRRPDMLAGLALAETIVAFGEPVPWGIEVHQAGQRIVVNVHLRDAGSVHAYQDRFGGVVHQQLHYDDGGRGVRLRTELATTVYDGEFVAWALSWLSEQELAAWFVGDHGDPADWSAETAVEYAKALTLVRAGGVR
ncbi:hypothetical protein [Kitasatospora sp. NPDC127116]|uniref:hypothetical protein n=1 Tax=Kitasatospora sp. NPDC127116 TaxID=3345367 RepID=UPI0036289CF9